MISALSVKSDSGLEAKAKRQDYNPKIPKSQNPKISKSLRSRQDNGPLQDKAVRRDWFSETQLRDGHKKDEGERKGMKSLGGSQALKTFLTWLFLFSGVLDGNAEGRESTKPGSSISAKRRGEAKGKAQSLQ